MEKQAGDKDRGRRVGVEIVNNENMQNIRENKMTKREFVKQTHLSKSWGAIVKEGVDNEWRSLMWLPRHSL